MAEYGPADPLWHRAPDGKGASMISLEHLPLSPELTARLRTWAHTFHDHTIANLANQDGNAWTAAAREEWAAEGHALLDLLRQELGPGYDVELYAPQRADT